MNLHLVGGFVGSGKTTAIAAAAKLLMASGKHVGVITNDQGKYLVDTAFFRAQHVPTVEVTGGCFCCNYDDLDARLAELQAKYQPNVIFAESVGSCADVVATVVKPLLDLSARPTSRSVFADSRLLVRRLRGDDLPFADKIVYIIDKQLEEAGLIVVNKVDLLDARVRKELAALAASAFPDKHVLTQSALDLNDVQTWIHVLESDRLPPLDSLEIDYERYGSGEAGLAWLDAEIELVLPDSDRPDIVKAFLVALENDLRAESGTIGHLKLIVKDGDEQTKISLTTLAEKGWEERIPDLRGNHPMILLNIRAQMDALRLKHLARRALENTLHGGSIAGWQVQVFHSDFPRPTHRIL